MRGVIRISNSRIPKIFYEIATRNDESAINLLRTAKILLCHCICQTNKCYKNRYVELSRKIKHCYGELINATKCDLRVLTATKLLRITKTWLRNCYGELIIITKYDLRGSTNATGCVELGQFHTYLSSK